MSTDHTPERDELACELVDGSASDETFGARAHAGGVADADDTVDTVDAVDAVDAVEVVETANATPADVRARADEFLAVQSQLRSGASPSAAQRESAINAALVEFDSLQLSTVDRDDSDDRDDRDDRDAAAQRVRPSERADNVVSIAGRQRRYYKLLSAAAAVAIVGVIGASALRNSGSNDADSSVAERASSEAGKGSANADVMLAPADTMATSFEDATAMETAAPAASYEAEATATGEALPTVGVVETQAIDTNEALLTFAQSQAIPPAQPGDSLAPFDDPRRNSAICRDEATVANGQAVGSVVWQGQLAIVYLTADNAAVALSDPDCVVLAIVPDGG
jgi:hypothetical protein